MDKNETWADDLIEVERLKAFMALSAEDKLRHLEELNTFLHQAMSTESKNVWKHLKKHGF